MTTLHPAQRALLERTITNARTEAERAATAALTRLAVRQDEPHAGLTPDEKTLRVQLRAEMRRLGGFDALVDECAYEQWHRMLFARFLAENDLLIHPNARVAVTLADCADLAEEEGEPDAWMVAARYAALMLPGIFRNDDPVPRLRFAAEGRAALERLLNDLPPAVFTAEDSLGWVYQFWQARKKDEVNRSGRKIGGEEIAPVTQLFTEPYMVQFLLHNSLGAWWAARHPDDALVPELTYLRRETLNHQPSTINPFPGWPDRAADLRVLDPCCGSGHFLVTAFGMLRRMRMAEEGLTEVEAADAVLRDNLFGLELDPRCTQIAAFNMALAAWKAGGWRELRVPHIACTGLKVGARLYEWTQLADGDVNLEATLRSLYHLFEKAPDVGSLLDPAYEARNEGALPLEWPDIAPLLEKALAKEKGADPAAAVFGETAQGAARAADLLSRAYHLVCTNVPYLARGKQDATLREFIEKYHNDARADLATAFVDRCLRFCDAGGATVLVTPQNWLFLGSYKQLRERLLTEKTWDMVAKLGPGAFETIGGEVVNVALFVLKNARPAPESALLGLDASAPRVPAEKAALLRCGPAVAVSQAGQLRNPDARVALDEAEGGALLERYAVSLQGVSPADFPHYGRSYWEVVLPQDDWHRWQSTVERCEWYGGRQHILWMCPDFHYAVGRGAAFIRGQRGWGKCGITVSAMRDLPATLYTGEPSDTNVAIILPHDPAHLPAIWCYCTSPEYAAAVRRIDQALKVTNASLVKVPFDLERWQKVAAERYPDGLPAPDSDDPTQWLFHGSVPRSTDPLQVAVARLLGYRWPRQQGMTVSGAGPVEDDGLGAHADADGIVCLPALAGEPPAAERLRALLADAYGAEWSPAVQERLLASAGSGGSGNPQSAIRNPQSLDEWLRDGLFAQHCRLFHNRPFVWHVWDGRRDGFSALVNYHALDRARLERLTYTYLGAWIRAQREADQRDVAGANARLVAALQLQEKLKAIAEGEPPYDIYVRWKPLDRQPIGWEPDLNDGVRLNIRPFVMAGVLRSRFTIHWNKDRGANPDGSERLNDLHYTRAEKEAPRRARGQS